MCTSTATYLYSPLLVVVCIYVMMVAVYIGGGMYMCVEVYIVMVVVVVYLCMRGAMWALMHMLTDLC